MAEKSARRDTSQADAVAHIREGETFAINLPVIGQVEIPRPEQLAYYGGLAALAAFELIDWPVAVVIMAGHLLAANHHNRLLEELGEAIASSCSTWRAASTSWWIGIHISSATLYMKLSGVRIWRATLILAVR